MRHVREGRRSPPPSSIPTSSTSSMSASTMTSRFRHGMGRRMLCCGYRRGASSRPASACRAQHRAPPARIAADLCAGLHAAHELTRRRRHPASSIATSPPHNVLVTRGRREAHRLGVAKVRDPRRTRKNPWSAASRGQGALHGARAGDGEGHRSPRRHLQRGAVTYQLLCGRAPSSKGRTRSRSSTRSSDEPRVRAGRSRPSPCGSCAAPLARRPENRFSDAAEMQNAIEPALVEMGAPDKPWDVAECLAGARAADGAARGDHRLLAPPPHSVRARVGPRDAAPAPVEQPAAPSLRLRRAHQPIPARRPSLIDPDEIAMQQRNQRGGGGSMRFVLLAAGAVGLLGVGAAMLVKDPTPSSNHGSDQPSTTEVDTAPITPTTSTATPSTPAANNTPNHRHGRRHGRAEEREEEAPPPEGEQRDRPDRGAEARARRRQDLAGDVKVWK